MKLFVLLALCGAAFATGGVNPLSLEGLKGKGLPMDTLIKSVVKDMGPMDVDAYRQGMTNVADAVIATMDDVKQFGDKAKDVLYNPDEESLIALGGEWDAMTDDVERKLDGMALRLLTIAFRLYQNADGFEETDWCSNYKNFDMVYDPTNPTVFLKEMGDVFLQDLECFLGLSSHIEELKNELNQEGEMAEEDAAGSAFGFLQGLHIFRLNAFRFRDAVDAAIAQMEESGDSAGDSSDLQQLRQLRNLLRRRGLFGERK